MKIIIRDSEHGRKETYNVREVRPSRKPALKDDKDEELSALEKRLDSLEEKLNKLLSKDEGEDEDAENEDAENEDVDEEEADDEDEVEEPQDNDDDEEEGFEGERVEDVKTTCDSLRKTIIPSPLKSVGAIVKKVTDSADNTATDAEGDTALSNFYNSKLKGDN